MKTRSVDAAARGVAEEVATSKIVAEYVHTIQNAQGPKSTARFQIMAEYR